MYLFLLPRGTTSVSVMSKMLGLARSSVKYHADELVQKGFASLSKRQGALWYTPMKPEKLYDLVERRREDANRLEHALIESMHELQALYNPHGNMPKVTFYEGVDGARDLLFAMVEEEGDLVSFGAGDYLLGKYPEMVEDFRRKAFTEYRRIRVIRSPKYKEAHYDDPAHMETRYFTAIDELTVDVQVREDKMSILSIDKGAPMGVLIEHEDITGAFRQIFDELWGRLPK